MEKGNIRNAKPEGGDRSWRVVGLRGQAGPGGGADAVTASLDEAFDVEDNFNYVDAQTTDEPTPSGPS